MSNKFFLLDPVKILKKTGITPNPKQLEILKSVEDASYVLTTATRRGGKSTIASAVACAKLLEPGTRVAVLGPLLEQTNIIFKNIENIMTQNLGVKPKRLDNKSKIMEFDWNSTLKCTTLRNLKSAVGFGNDLIILDECALADMDDYAFLFEELIPTLLEKNGKLLCITTPRGHNWYKSLWDYADTDDEWRKISYTIHEITHISKDKVSRLYQQYKNLNLLQTWDQEFECKFNTFSGAIFSFQPQIVKSCPDPDLIVTAIDPGMNTGFIKCSINKEHGVFVTFVSETQNSTLEHGKMLQEHTEDSDLNVYDPAAKQFAIDTTMEFDISLTKAKKSVEEGINFLRRLDGWLYVLDTCDGVFMREWSDYRMVNDKIVKKADHTVDCIKYCLYTAWVFWGDEFFPFLNDEVESLWEK